MNDADNNATSGTERVDQRITPPARQETPPPTGQTRPQLAKMLTPHVPAGLALVGLALAGIGVVQLAIAKGVPWLLGLGWLLIFCGLLVLVRLGRTVWPEVLVAALIVLIILAAQRGPPPAQPEQDVRIPIPADKIEGGTEFLSPKQLVGLNVVVPNASKTPEVQASTYGTVIEIRGKEKPVVLIEVAPDSADSFQLALQADGAKVAYRLAKTTPITTLTAEVTATPVPIPGPTDRAFGDKRGYVEIAVADLKSRASTLDTAHQTPTPEEENVEAQLVIAEKRVVPVGAAEAVTTTHMGRTFCVQVEAFLDKEGNKQTTYNSPGKTAFVLLSFPIDRLEEIAASLAGADGIWIEKGSCPP